jgi:hypothetical protein
VDPDGLHCHFDPRREWAEPLAVAISEFVGSREVAAKEG